MDRIQTKITMPTYDYKTQLNRYTSAKEVMASEDPLFCNWPWMQASGREKGPLVAH
jgi:hypothetical protein